MANPKRSSSSPPMPSSQQLPWLLLAVVVGISRGAQAALLQGCDFGDELCDKGEICVPDGLFGQCYSDPEAALVRPLILDRALNDAQSEVLRLELGRLAELGLDWPHARAQCVLAYFKMAVAFQLDYDTEFCSVRDPSNIWALVQRVQNALLAEEEQQQQQQQAEVAGGQQQPSAAGGEDEGLSLLTEGGDGEETAEKGAEESQKNHPQQKKEAEEEMPAEAVEPVELIPVLLLEEDPDAEEEEQQQQQPVYELAEAASSKNETDVQKRSSTGAAAEPLAPQEEAQLDKLLHQMLASRRASEAPGLLNDRQLNRLVQFVRQLQNLLHDSAVQKAEQAEQRLAQELEHEEQAAEAEQQQEEAEEEAAEPVLLLKKDSEQFNNADMGLAHTVHKIVKGGIQRVEGNRVYLRVAKENLTEEELYKLIAYLDRKIAMPNRLYFDQFLYEDGQLSFRISRPMLDAKAASAAATKPSPTLGSASGVAQAVYKRRKDIQTLAGVRVDETGIGSGQDVVPVERSQRDQLFVPILTVCALTISALLSVLAASLISRRRQKANTGPLLPQTMHDQMDGKLYEQLCRQRATESPSVVVEAASRSKNSSTSSWPGDEPAPAASDLDIGTGHVLLSFLQKLIEQPGEMTKQWESVRNYAPQEAQTQTALKPENAAKNLDASALPYDDSRVQLHASGGDLVQLGEDYVNASKIYDSNPEYPAYIAAQAPLEATVAQFWQMTWEQGIGLVVNLCDQQETSSDAYFKYWPEEGSKTFGAFEIHLVSEHIWSEHYVVRSLYLKNLATQETRTITQFHFLSWPAGGVPGSNKALLEFRRKVNKSYRGRASPVLVHCSNGGGRTGTYILIDMTANRIQKGVKELNIAASLEHLRDQRMGMVENEQQFKCVFNSVADEVSSLLKGLQH